MPLPHAVLLPHALLPLYLFEERYRQMLAHCLERERMFCVALMKEDRQDAETSDDFYPIAGLGLIRACVGNSDGTSHLVLQGLARVQLLDLIVETPFRIAQIRPLPSIDAQKVEAEALSAKVVELCDSMRIQGFEIPDALAKQLPQLTDPNVLSDVIANTFVRDPHERQALLMEVRVPERLRRLIAALKRENNSSAE